MEARSKLLDPTTPSRRWIRKVVLILPLLLLFLLRTQALQGLESDERFRTRENECHFYAGGQVYPGEVSRVSVADHSLHLSKAKSRWCPAEVGWMGKNSGILRPFLWMLRKGGAGVGPLPQGCLRALGPPRCLCGCEDGFLVWKKMVSSDQISGEVAVTPKATNGGVPSPGLAGVEDVVQTKRLS